MDSDNSPNPLPDYSPESPSSSVAGAWSPISSYRFLRSPDYSPNSPSFVLTSPEYSPTSPSYSPSPIHTPYSLGSPATIMLNSDVDSDFLSDYEPTSGRHESFSPSPQHLDATQDTQYDPSTPDSLISISPIVTDADRLDDTDNVHVLKNRVRQLEQENEKLRKDFTCIICLTDKRNCIFMPCCHFNTCEPCAQKLEQCAVCRGKISGRLKIFEN